MGTKHYVSLMHEYDNYEGSGYEGAKLWRKVLSTYAYDYEDALDRLLPRIKSFMFSYTDTYKLKWKDGSVTNVTRAVRNKLFRGYYRKVPIATIRKWYEEKTGKKPTKEMKKLSLFYGIYRVWQDSEDYPKTLPYPPTS